MSRLTEIQNQYQEYVLASELARQTNPGEVEVVYKESGNLSGKNGTDGIFTYIPRENRIVIRPRRDSASAVPIDADDVPALIKALREFFE
jgi:hypothetical protein